LPPLVEASRLSELLRVAFIPLEGRRRAKRLVVGAVGGSARSNAAQLRV
jgi:hypothetical protein